MWEVILSLIESADRLKPETFPDVRDINDKLKIAVVLVGVEPWSGACTCHPIHPDQADVEEWWSAWQTTH